MIRLILIALLIVNTSCASRRMLSDNNAVTSPGVMKVWANWVKDKGEKFDIQFVMQNLQDTAMIVKLHDVQCARGKRTGSIKHTFFNTGERTIDLMPHESKRFNLVCRVGVDSRGPFNMRIVKVYANPEQDGESIGQVIAKNIIWSIPEED